MNARLAITLFVSAIACGPASDASSRDSEHASAKEAWTIAFHVPPAQPNHSRSTDRSVDVWSANDDLDSVLVVLHAPSGSVEATIDRTVELRPISAEERVPGDTVSASTSFAPISLPRLRVRLDTLKREYGGVILLRFSPGSLDRELPLPGGSAIAGVGVTVHGDGETATARLRILFAL